MYSRIHNSNLRAMKNIPRLFVALCLQFLKYFDKCGPVSVSFHRMLFFSNVDGSH